MNALSQDLDGLGWNEHWEQAFERCATSSWEPGRVVSDGTVLMVQTRSRRLLAKVPHQGGKGLAGGVPVCGDWVAVEPHPGTQRASVRAILPRRTEVWRRAAGRGRDGQILLANVDAIWIVCGLDRTQGIRSLMRYQTLVRGSDAEILILLNKSDTCPDIERATREAEAEAPGVPIYPLSATTRGSLELLKPLIEARMTIGLLGPSGAGKTTLVGALAKDPLGTTQSVRDSDRRGRHTTSHRQLVPTRGRALLVDTPGLRELGLWDSETGLDETFSDIVELSVWCRFRDCHHGNEPGCAVREALEDQRLTPERFLAYLELVSEAVPKRRTEQRGRVTEAAPKRKTERRRRH